MPFPIKTCAICGEEFELKPGKPGLAIHCPSCSEDEEQQSASGRPMDADERRMQSEADAERRKAIRDLLYRKDS